MLTQADIEKANNISIELHSSIIDQTDDEHKIVGQNEHSHNLRLDKILELANFNNKSLLDIGCGLGALYKKLKDKNINADYFGIDINPKLLAKAKERYPEVSQKFSLFDIIENDINRNFDYIVAVGTINLEFGKNINMQLMEKLILEMNKHSEIGFALSMTSALTKKPNSETFYYRPEDILFIISKFCNNFKIDHSFLPHDFAIFCYKHDFYTK